MHRSQRIERKKAATVPQIVDIRQPKAVPQTQSVDPAVANLPLRTVFFMEVGDMETAKIQLLVQEVNAAYRDNKGGPHYVLAVRHGRIGSDLVFEKEFLDIVNEICEVKDGQIVLRDGAQDAVIVRQSI